MLTAFFVAARIVANPLSNVFQKRMTARGANALFIVGATHALLTLVCAPLCFVLPIETRPGFAMDMLICALLAVSSNAVLVRALQSSDLSVLGPINAYKAVVGMLIGALMLGEIPTLKGACGVALIVAGSYFVVDRAPHQSRAHAIRGFVMERGVQLRFLALLLSATEAVFLKRAVLESAPVTVFLFWSILGLPIAAAAIALLGGWSGEAARFGRFAGTYLWLAFTTGLMQLTTLLTFGKMQVGYSLALFQLSALLSVLLGYRYFRERNIGRRLIGATVMIAGAALIIAR